MLGVGVKDVAGAGVGTGTGVGIGAGARTGAVPCFALTDGAVATLRTLLENSLAELECLELDERALAEVEQVVAQVLAFHGH